MSQPLNAPDAAPISLLVVEDEAIVARDIEVTLRGLGYAVAGTAADGASAIAAAESLRPDLVLMDIRLRGPIDGIEAATEIWRRLGIAVVFLSAYTDEDTLARARAALPFGYLVKPFLGQQLRPAIEVAVHKERTERELRRSDRQIRAALEALQAGVVIADATGHVRWHNGRAAQLLLAKTRGLLGSALGDLLRGIDVATPAPGTGQASVLGGHGEPIPVDYCRAPLEDGAGSMVVTFREAARQQGELRESDRRALDALSQVASGLADHTRAPLLALSSTLQLVEVHGGAGLVGAGTLPLLRRQVERIRDLVNYVVQFAGSGLAVERVAAAELVTAAVDRIRPLADQRGVTVAVRGGAAWPELVVDRTRVETALEAVIENAVQHSRSHGEVLISGRSEKGGRSLRLMVEDNGPGFTEADIARACEPFFSRRAGGTGMGLALARRVVELHAGALEIANRNGGGARVVLELPLSGVPT